MTCTLDQETIIIPGTRPRTVHSGRKRTYGRNN